MRSDFAGGAVKLLAATAITGAALLGPAVHAQADSLDPGRTYAAPQLGVADPSDGRAYAPEVNGPSYFKTATLRPADWEFNNSAAPDGGWSGLQGVHQEGPGSGAAAS
ncbi:hypothetical protein [Streptacidiphilus anmyonensis]|uniref:hypothetical protein n=1 Tax=Streptacidiphilus anmyonensis TaxID=405782 RepID=UPI0005AB0FCF|nr:hypothetical protein [Streptacidiphilus anmyonensis]